MNTDPKIKRTKHPYIALPRLPLVSQVYFWCLIALGILVVISSVSAWLITDAQAYSAIDSITSDTLDSFQSELSDDINALVLFGKWFANDGSTSIFGDSIKGSDTSKEMQTILQMEDLDFILITDDRGQVLAKSGPAGILNLSNDISGLPEIVDALAGRPSIRTEVDTSGLLAVKYTLPRYVHLRPSTADSSSQSIAGAITLGFYIDEDYLKTVKKKASFDMGLVVISKDQLAASKLTSRGASLQMAQLAPGNSTLDEGAFNGSHLVTLNTNHGPYLYKFEPLTVPTRSNSIVIGSGVPTNVLDAEHAKWLKIMGAWMLFALFDLAVIGFFIARTFTRPLKALSAAVQQIESGNLANRIILRRADEFGDLAAQLESMRKELSQKFAKLNFEKTGLSTAISILAAPVVITDAQNRIAVVNHAAEAVFGSKNQPLTGRSWNSLFTFPEGSDSHVFPVLRQVRSVVDDMHPMIVHQRLVLGTERQSVLDVSTAPIHVGQELIGYIHTLNDVSEIDRFAKSKNEFLLSVAHELQGPLASWRASVDLLIEDYLEMTRSELGTMLRTLQKTVLRFQGLVEALVDMGKLEAGKFRIMPVPMLFDKLIKDSLAQIDSVPRAKGQDIDLRIGTSPDSRVMADRARIAQVIINLVRNASKYSPDGSTIIVETYPAAGRLFFQVTDQGNGISPDEQGLIFERYYRSKRVEEDGSGIGLGLALAKAIVEAHGGQIGVSSEPGKGSTFWFSLSEIDTGENENELGDINESVNRGR